MKTLSYDAREDAHEASRPRPTEGSGDGLGTLEYRRFLENESYDAVKSSGCSPLDPCRQALFLNDNISATRILGVESILDLSRIYGVHDETATHAIALLDRILLSQIQKASPSLRKEIETHSFACFIIASKMVETSSPALSDLAKISGFRRSIESIQQAERHVLESLDWDVHMETGEHPTHPFQNDKLPLAPIIA